MAKGLMLLIQTKIACLIRGKIYRRFLFSYILFIIIIGRIVRHIISGTTQSLVMR